jgi:uncharacterized membrane protein YhaH (DUF805 family)
MAISKESVLGLLKKWFNFSGRATRKDYWMTVLWQFVCAVALILHIVIISAIFKDWLVCLLSVPFVVALLSLIVAAYANLFRRFHDLGLSGFWTCYLTPCGLFFMYGAYVMDADKTATIGIDRIKKVGSPWLSWILAYVFWPMASLFGMLLVLLSPGQKEDNVYGPNPYV